MLNDYGFDKKITRTDNYTPPPLDNYYARMREAERLLSRRRLRRCDLAKYLGVSLCTASRMLRALTIAIPLAEDDSFRWYVIGTEAEKCS